MSYGDLILCYVVVIIVLWDFLFVPEGGDRE